MNFCLEFAKFSEFFIENSLKIRESVNFLVNFSSFSKKIHTFHF